MSRATNEQIGAGFSQGLQNFVKGFTERKAKEKEQSRVKDLLKRLENATDAEKVSIYGELDPKLALGFEIANEKNKQRAQTQAFIANEAAKDFGGAPSEPQEYQGAGLGGPQARVTQPVDPTAATATQPGFKPNAPNMAARNATALRPNFPGNQNFNEVPLVQGQAPVAQAPQPQQQQLTPKQEAQRLRAKGAQLNAMQHGAGDAWLAQAKAIETEQLKDKEFQQKQEFEVRKGNEKYRQDLLKGIPATKKLKSQLGKLKELNKKELLTPAAVKALNFFGVPLGVFDTADEQELDKVALDLTANIQQDYGSRILQSEFNTYLRRIPSLMNSKEGRDRIIENMEIYAEAKEVEQKAYTDLYKLQKDSGIKHPLVTQEDVMQYADKELNTIFAKLNDNIMKDTGTKEKAKLLPKSAAGTVRMALDGKFYDFPADQVDLRRTQGFSPL